MINIKSVRSCRSPFLTSFMSGSVLSARHPKQDFIQLLSMPGINVNIWNATSDGRLEISNNRAERSIKPFVIGRKNWLFANTPRGAKASAIMFSIIATTTENGLNPYEYLTYVFKNAPNWDIRNNIDNLERLLPWFAPDSCKSKK